MTSRPYRLRPLAQALCLAACLAAGAPGDAQERSASAHYEAAVIAFEKGELEVTAVELKAALNKDPGFLSAHLLVAEVYLQIGEPAAAHDALQRARRLGADPNLVWPLRARAYAEERRFKELLALTPEEGLRDGPQARVLVLRGKALMETGDLDKAEAAFRHAAELAPGDGEPLVALATASLRRGDHDGAQARARNATEVDPGNAATWAVLGDVLHARGSLPDAIGAYDRALAIDPRLLDARIARAGAHIDLEDLAAAAVDIRFVREEFPLEPRAAYLESVLLAHSGQARASEAALRRAVELLEDYGPSAQDRSMQLVLLAGIANYELGEYEQAQTQLERYLDHHPDQPGPRKLLGSVLLKAGRVKEAIATLEPALVNAPNDIRLMALLGAAYSRDGRHDLAAPYLEKAVRLSGGAAESRARRALNRVAAGDEEAGLNELEEVFAGAPTEQLGVGMSLASLYLKRGADEDALRIARQVAAARPDDPTVLNLLGSAQLKLGLSEDAQGTFERALSFDPDYLPALVNLGKVDADAGRFGEARQHLTEALERRPEHVPTMLALARIERRLGNIEESFRWLQKARGAAPRSVAAALALAEHYLEEKDFQEALRVVSEADGLEAENQDVLATLARVHRAMERDDLALEVYRRMSLVAGFDSAKLLRVARLQAEAGALGDAVFSLEKALKDDADNRTILLRLAGLRVQLGRLEQAMEIIAVLLDRYPDLAVAHRLKGDALLAGGDAEAAIASYEAALALAPLPPNLLALYRARVSAGQDAASLALLQQWLEHNADDAAIRSVLADRYLSLGDYPRARVEYERVLEAFPSNVNVLNNLAHVLDRLGDPGAMAVAEKALSLAPSNPAALDTVGWMLVRQGDATRGLSLLREAYSRAAGNPVVRYHVAAALAALGRQGEARRELREVLARFSDFEGSAEARALLEKLDR